MATLMLANPRKRRTTKRRRTSVTKSTRRRYRRNPIAMRGAMATVKKGAVGAAGALAVDMAFGKLPIPATLKVGAMAPAVKGLLGVGIGMLVSKFGKNRVLGEQLAEGAVTVALYGVGKNMVGPAMGLSGDSLLGYDDSLLGYTDDGMMGYMNPAQVYDAPEFGYYDGNDDY